LTVYGKGGQTRGYLNIRDTMQCVYLSATQPAGKGELRVFNQVTETFSVSQLAEKVKTVGDRLGYNVQLKNIENPRVEKEDHYYNPKYTGLLDLGLEPHYLTNDALEEMFKVVGRCKDRINKDAIFRGIKWK
jgi:UDP-sulfoquinovose synthase